MKRIPIYTDACVADIKARSKILMRRLSFSRATIEDAIVIHVVPRAYCVAKPSPYEAILVVPIQDNELGTNCNNYVIPTRKQLKPNATK
jgi:hypothetical protein